MYIKKLKICFIILIKYYCVYVLLHLVIKFALSTIKLKWVANENGNQVSIEYGR